MGGHHGKVHNMEEGQHSERCIYNHLKTRKLAYRQFKYKIVKENNDLIVVPVFIVVGDIKYDLRPQFSVGGDKLVGANMLFKQTQNNIRKYKLEIVKAYWMDEYFCKPRNDSHEQLAQELCANVIKYLDIEHNDFYIEYPSNDIKITVIKKVNS